jgi:hypothetical protein
VARRVRTTRPATCTKLHQPEDELEARDGISTAPTDDTAHSRPSPRSRPLASRRILTASVASLQALVLARRDSQPASPLLVADLGVVRVSVGPVRPLVWHSWLERLHLRSSRPWKFAESYGSLPEMARSSMCVARCPSATPSGVVGTSSRDRRVPIGSRRPTIIRGSRCTEGTSHPTTSDLRIGSATNVTTGGG